MRNRSRPPRPIGTTTTGRRALVAPLLVSLSVLVTPLSSASVSAQSDERVVTATNVACRVSGETSAAAAASLELGETGRVVDRQHAPGESPSGSTRANPDSTGWVLLDSPQRFRPCWVHASLTAPFDRSRPEDALLAVADHILATDDRPFEEYVRAENLFVDPPWRVAPDSAPVLALRRLQLVDAALSTEPRWEIEKDPLKYAWILAHEHELVYNEPGGNWYVARDRYWDLFERFRDTALAEELAWTAASRPLLGECEGYLDCQLETILRSVAGYWERFPDGRFLGEALAAAEETTGAVRRGACEESGPERTISGTVLAEIRGSLEAVASAAKERILDHLEAIERCASETTAQLPVGFISS